MVKAGYSPSVRLFEAAACGTPIISDHWEGIETIFEPGKEILISHSAEQTLEYLNTMRKEERRAIGEAANRKAMQFHTAAHRAVELEKYYNEAVSRGSMRHENVASQGGLA
jgi:spore maturation protein CgeB